MTLTKELRKALMNTLRAHVRTAPSPHDERRAKQQAFVEAALKGDLQKKYQMFLEAKAELLSMRERLNVHLGTAGLALDSRDHVTRDWKRIIKINRPPCPAPPRDIDGVPWDVRIHSCKAPDGRWRRKKGVTTEVFEAVMQELRGEANEAN